MRLKCFDFLCNECEEKTEHYVDTSVRDWDIGQTCGNCGSRDTFKVMSAPEIRTEDNAVTFLDGTKRKGAQDMKKVAKLEVQRAGLRPNSPERAAINKEISERKKLK